MPCRTKAPTRWKRTSASALPPMRAIMPCRPRSCGIWGSAPCGCCPTTRRRSRRSSRRASRWPSAWPARPSRPRPTPANIWTSSAARWGTWAERSSAAGGAGHDLELAHLARQAVAVDAQLLGGLAHLSLLALEHALDEAAFEFGDGLVQADALVHHLGH